MVAARAKCTTTIHTERANQLAGITVKLRQRQRERKKTKTREKNSSIIRHTSMVLNGCAVITIEMFCIRLIL